MSRMAPTPTSEGHIPFEVPGHAQLSCSTYYKVFGDLSSGAPAVVVLHGGPGAGHEYLLPFAELWSKYGLPVVFYDQIGCAASTHLPQLAGDKDFWQESLFVAELNNLLDHLQLRDGPGFHLLGQSWGGMLGAAFAASRPNGLQRLILASGVASKELSMKGIQLRRSELPADVRKALAKCIREGDYESQAYKESLAVFRKMFLSRADPVPEELKLALQHLSEDKTVYGTMYGPSGFVCNGSLREWTSIPRLPQITTPTLVYNGEYDTSHDMAQEPFFELIPKEFTCFSYDENHKFRQDESSLRWYYPPALGSNLSKGFENFVKHDDSQDEHLDSLLESIISHELETGKPIDAQIVTWRGMLTKFMAAPFEDRDGFEMNATLYRDCIFIEENHAHKLASRREQDSQPWRGPISQEVMSFWGYKFETLSTLPAPWGETSREYIENRDSEVVNNKEQYCSVVRTGIGKTILCLGGEVDAVWDAKPVQQGAPINWVELKTSQEVRSDRDIWNFERKLMKFWIQSFLLGVPKIIVGFRSQNGVLQRLEEIETATIPVTAQRRGKAGWDGNTCINFASAFLEWLRQSINDDGVWRIRRKPRSSSIEVFRVEETGHGRILTDDFINWRIKLSLKQTEAEPQN